MCGILCAISTECRFLPARDLLFSSQDEVAERGTSSSWIEQPTIGLRAVFSRLATDGVADSSIPQFSDSMLLLNGLLVNVEKLCSNFNLSDEANLFDSRCLEEGVKRFGLDFLSQCDGMFAGVFCDSLKTLIFRDPSGIKPLYYGKINDNSNVWIISSILNPFVHLKCSEVFEVQPGEVITFDKRDGEFKKEIFETQIDIEDPADYLQTVISKSAKRYLNKFPDKNIGVLLSGGIDSSLVLKILADQLSERELSRVFAFCVGAEGSLDQSYSQTFIEELSEKGKKISLIKVHPYSAEEAIARIPEIIRILGSSNPRDIYVSLLNERLAQTIAQREINIVYTGQGADEICGGYLEEFRTLFPRLSSLENMNAHELYRKKVFSGSLLQRDDRIFSYYKIETRPIFAFPGFVKSFSEIPALFRITAGENEAMSKKYLRKLALKIFQLPEKIANREKFRMERCAYRESLTNDPNQFGLTGALENSVLMAEKVYFEEVFKQIFPNINVISAQWSESEFIENFKGTSNIKGDATL